jgi:hypothetical protein
MTALFARRSILGYCVGGAASAVLLASASRSDAATSAFKASLHGKNEVPPNNTTGTASVTVTYDPATKRISWEGTYTGLTGPVTAAHIHGPADPGKNAPPVVWLSKKGDSDPNFPSPFTGSAELTDEQAKELMFGRYYVNIHTKANPAGEIRGQLNKS